MIWYVCSLTILDILSSKPFCTAPLHLLIASFTSLGSWGSELPPPPNTPIIWCVWVDCFFCVIWNAFEGNTMHIIIRAIYKKHILCVPPPNDVAIDLLQLCLPIVSVYLSPSLFQCFLSISLQYKDTSLLSISASELPTWSQASRIYILVWQHKQSRKVLSTLGCLIFYKLYMQHKLWPCCPS